MEFQYFSRNGELLPIERAQVSLTNIEYQYGFGVYESLRVTHGRPFFVREHLARLMESARIIGLEHPFTPESIEKNIGELIHKNAVQDCNIKILLIGGLEPELAILCLNPLYLNKTMYRDGVHTVTYGYQRPFPHAKTLSMIESYLSFKKAKEAGAYDALLVDRAGNIREGSHTNFFCLSGTTLVSPPEEHILLGVTRAAVIKVARENGFDVVEKEIPLAELAHYDGALLTGTSPKIVPVRFVDEHEFAPPSTALAGLMKHFDRFLDTSGGVLE